MNVHPKAMAAALLLVAASASGVSAQNFHQYACEDGSQVGVVFIQNPNSAVLQLDGKSVTLPQRMSGSGARYKKSGVTFWIKGKDAQLKRPKKKWTTCNTS